MSDDKETIYVGGFAQLMAEETSRLQPFDDVQTVLPPADVDLHGLLLDRVPPPLKVPQDSPKHSAERTWMTLQAEFEGQSGLFLVHAMLVRVLSRISPPEAALALFLHCWIEKGDELAQNLPSRWLLAAARVFADHGRTADQRALGLGLSMLFDLIKLHESERRLSGRPGYKPFRRIAGEKLFKIPLGMTPYSMKSGHLDRSLLTRLWAPGQREPTMRPLSMRLLNLVMTDQRTVFARLEKLKRRKAS